MFCPNLNSLFSVPKEGLYSSVMPKVDRDFFYICVYEYVFKFRGFKCAKAQVLLIFPSLQVIQVLNYVKWN